MSAFVGTQMVESKEELISLLQEFEHSQAYYFLRWPHTVSGFCQKLPRDFEQSPSPEGQLFDHQKELRWKRQGQGYSILLLNAEGDYPNFQAVGNSWNVHQVQNAHPYPKTETRFPKGLNYKDEGFDLGQRYFFDPQTATVHFVALTVS
jgi:hypothetical protein